VSFFLQRYALTQCDSLEDASMVPSPSGDWVSRHYAEREINALRAIVDALPMCEHHECRGVYATSVNADAEFLCDAHKGDAKWVLPYVSALRAWEARK
jgi:hypothetical protein